MSSLEKSASGERLEKESTALQDSMARAQTRRDYEGLDARFSDVKDESTSLKRQLADTESELAASRRQVRLLPACLSVYPAVCCSLFALKLLKN